MVFPKGAKTIAFQVIKRIIITTSFIAKHSWPDCPIEHKHYLTYPHRHKFNIKAKFNIEHSDRDKEFITYKEMIKDYVNIKFEGKYLKGMSCEMMAEKIISEFIEFGIHSVEVWEDKENGAEVIVDINMNGVANNIQLT